MATRQRLMKILAKETKRRKPSPQLREAAKKKKWDIVRGDKVEVIGVHPERGKQGIVKKVIREQDRVIVEGVNMGAKHIKKDEARGIKGHKIMKERTIHYSKVNLVDPSTGFPTRFYKKFLEDGTKVRVAKKSGAIIPKPDVYLERKPKSSFVSDQCTTDAAVWEQTFEG